MCWCSLCGSLSEGGGGGGGGERLHETLDTFAAIFYKWAVIVIMCVCVYCVGVHVCVCVTFFITRPRLLTV